MIKIKQILWLMIGFVFFVHCKNEQKTEDSKIELPIVSIHYDTLSSYQKVPCTLSLDDTLVLEGKIKHRGGSSIGYPKKSYTVKLSENISLYGLNTNKSWVFTSSYLEKSLIRNILSYDMFRDWDENNVAPQIQLVEFYCQNQYEGIYQLTEKINRNRLGFEKENGGVVFKDCAVFSKTPIEPQSGETYYHQKYPKPKKYDATQEMDSLREFILHAPDSVFENKVEEIVEIQNIMDWQIMMMLSNNGDAVYKNFYLYRLSKDSKFSIALWDYDSGFGRDTDNELNLMKTTSHWERNSLLDRLYHQNVNGYKNRLHQRWAELRNNEKISVSNFENRVDKLAAELKPFVDKNFERWPVTASYYWDEYTWEQELGVLTKFINLRIPQLDKKFNYNGR